MLCAFCVVPPVLLPFSTALFAHGLGWLFPISPGSASFSSVYLLLLFLRRLMLVLFLLLFFLFAFLALCCLSDLFCASLCYSHFCCCRLCLSCCFCHLCCCLDFYSCRGLYELIRFFFSIISSIVSLAVVLNCPAVGGCSLPALSFRPFVPIGPLLHCSLRRCLLS